MYRYILSTAAVKNSSKWGLSSMKMCLSWQVSSKIDLQRPLLLHQALQTPQSVCYVKRKKREEKRVTKTDDTFCVRKTIYLYRFGFFEVN